MAQEAVSQARMYIANRKLAHSVTRLTPPRTIVERHTRERLNQVQTGRTGSIPTRTRYREDITHVMLQRSLLSVCRVCHSKDAHTRQAHSSAIALHVSIIEQPEAAASRRTGCSMLVRMPLVDRSRGTASSSSSSVDRWIGELGVHGVWRIRR